MTNYDPNYNANVPTPQAAPATPYAGGWGQTNVKTQATSIVHTAATADFGLKILESLIASGDVFEKECVMYANGQNPPPREWLLALAARMDDTQRQMREAVQSIRQFQHEIKNSAAPLQNRGGW